MIKCCYKPPSNQNYLGYVMHGMVKVKIRVETMSEWTALTCHQVMWEGEWRDVYAKTTAAFTRSYIHFSFSLIVSKGVQALMQLLTHTPGPHTPHVIHMSLFRSLTSSHPLNVSAWVHHSYGFDVPIRSCLQWRVLVLGPCYNKCEGHTSATHPFAHSLKSYLRH